MLNRTSMCTLVLGLGLFTTACHIEGADPATQTQPASRAVTPSPGSPPEPLANLDSFFQHQAMVRNVYCPAEKQEQYSAELKDMLRADQADRAVPNQDNTQIDTQRRSRVAVMAAESCLKNKDDYFAAAVIFQHGNTPDHYLQATIYANKAAALGHPIGGPMREATIDRYLMSSGHKQIFGSQITVPAAYKSVESDADTIPCLWPIDDTINIVDDYPLGSADDHLRIGATVAAKKQQFAECDFAAHESKDNLQMLLKTKI